MLETIPPIIAQKTHKLAKSELKSLSTAIMFINEPINIKLPFGIITEQIMNKLFFEVNKVFKFEKTESFRDTKEFFSSLTIMKDKISKTKTIIIFIKLKLKSCERKTLSLIEESEEIISKVNMFPNPPPCTISKKK